MVKKNKVSDLKGQHDRINSLDELFERFANRQLHSKITDGLSLNRCTEGGFHSPEMVKDPLSEMLREGARLLIATAVRGELEDFMEQYKDRRLEDGRVAVVRNGYLPERDIQTGLGSVKVQIPKVRSKDGKPVVFHSALVPRYVRKTATLEAALPWLYLKGISTGEMGPALDALIGPEAKGLSQSTVSRLKRKWAEQYRGWRGRSLDEDQWVYVWADGIYSNIRAEDSKMCALVLIGVNQRGEKHFLAIENGVRESKQSWLEVFLKLRDKHGMGAPKLAIGDGALGFWAAAGEVYPQTPHQRCWVHKTANVLNYLPKSSQSGAKDALHDIWRAETRENAQEAFDLFLRMYEGKYPRAAQCLLKDREELMAFYDFPAEHWQSIRTTNPIESVFATIRHRTKRCRGSLNQDGMLHMIFKLGMCAETNWRKLRGFKYLGKVMTGVKFKNGIEVSKEKTTNDQIAA